MTLDTLIQQLQELRNDCGGNTQVSFLYSSGDYWGTSVLGQVQNVDVADVVFNEYHQKFAPCSEDECSDVQHVILE